MAFHLDHLKNYHRRFCRPSRALGIHTKQGQNVLEILQDCFEEHNSTESLPCSTPKGKDSSNRSEGKECQASSHSKSVPVSSRRRKTSLQVAVEPDEAACGSVQTNEIHQKTLATDAVSKSIAASNDRPRESAASDNTYASCGAPVILLDEKMSKLKSVISSPGQKRVASVSRNSVDRKPSNTDISFKSRKRLNFEGKSILNEAEVENNVLEVEDNISEVQKGTSLETSQKRRQDLSCEVEPLSKKSFSTLYLETVKRKSESSFIVKHTAAVQPPSSPPNDMKVLEDEFIIEESDRSFASQPWVTIPRKGRGPSHHSPSHENIVTPKDKKSREKPPNVSARTLRSDTQSLMASPIGKSQASVEKVLGTSCVDELENDYRSTENTTHSKNVKKTICKTEEKSIEA